MQNSNAFKKPVGRPPRTGPSNTVMLLAGLGGTALLLLMALLPKGLGWLIGPHGEDCGTILSWANASTSLPETARDARCERTVWQNTSVTATFRMPRGEVADWLRDAYPDADGHDNDNGLFRTTGYPIEAKGPAAVDITVTYEDGETVLVELSAYQV
ncbi:hypothetical protein ACFVQ4_20515 [Streptomyces laurentii]|uniref:hypothetical protein n=1 Tax=Streptomyces laurentii TaxID=39478 RepID=UPI0036C0B45C